MPDRDDVIGTSGCVYEHILVAESILGRRLLPGETVHHKDRNRANNSPENLMVFKSTIATSETEIIYLMNQSFKGC